MQISQIEIRYHGKGDNMRKIVIGLLLIFLLTGCNANYSIKISDGKIVEKFEVVEENMDLALKKDETERSFKDYAEYYGSTSSTYSSFYNLYADEGCNGSCEYYDKIFINQDSKIGFILDHIFDYENYVDSSLANELLPSFESSFDGRFLTISGGSSWNFINGYSALNEVTINVETDYKVTSTNAKKNGNTYSWKINKDNYLSQDRIYIIIDTSNTIQNESSNSSSMLLLIIIMIILIISGLFLLYMKKKDNVYN